MEERPSKVLVESTSGFYWLRKLFWLGIFIIFGIPVIVVILDSINSSDTSIMGVITAAAYIVLLFFILEYLLARRAMIYDTYIQPSIVPFKRMFSTKEYFVDYEDIDLWYRVKWTNTIGVVLVTKEGQKSRLYLREFKKEEREKLMETLIDKINMYPAY